MKEYEVSIVETLKKTVTVEADAAENETRLIPLNRS